MVQPPRFPAYLDNTIREAWDSCQRKAYYQYLCGWSSEFKSVDLHFGGAFASGIEYARKKFFGEGLSGEESALLGALLAHAEYGTFIPAKETNKTRAAACVGVLSYFHQYPMETEPFVPHVVGGKPCIEFNFTIPIPVRNPETDEPIIYTGRFDELSTNDGVLYLKDEKTTSRLGGTWGNQWELAGQFTGYAWGAREYGYPVVGALIRGVSALKGGFGHLQIISARTPIMIERWYEEMIRDAQDMREAWIRGDWRYSFGAACKSYNGCHFVPVCSALEPERVLPLRYVQSFWDPLTRTRDGEA